MVALSYVVKVVSAVLDLVQRQKMLEGVELKLSALLLEFPLHTQSSLE